MGTATERLDKEAAKWDGKWARFADKAEHTTVILQGIASSAQSDDLDALTLADLDGALYRMSLTTGRGADATGPGDYRHLPVPAKEEYLDIIRNCEEKRMWPWQVLINIQALMDKPTGGKRTISLMCMMPRIWSCMRGHRPSAGARSGPASGTRLWPVAVAYGRDWSGRYWMRLP